MGKIKVHEFTTIDGVVGAPMWTMDYEFTQGMMDTLAPLTASCPAILLGRNTYDGFYPAWSTRTEEEDPGAPYFNNTPKYVVSSTLKDPEWNNTTVLGPYDVETIQKLKDSVDGGIYVSGSVMLVRQMIADGLVDELHLLVYPLALGEGPYLFPEGTAKTVMKLAEAKAIDNGVVHLVYTPA